jgi:hypothetical protein
MQSSSESRAVTAFEQTKEFFGIAWQLTALLITVWLGLLAFRRGLSLCMLPS